MRLFHAFLTVPLLLLGPSLAPPAGAIDADAEPADLAGIYVCQGKNFDGTSYQGAVQITKQNDTFQLVWFSEDSQIAAVGMGIRNGDVLAVAYYSGVPGVVAYRIEQGERLVGEWTSAAAEGEVRSETLIKVPADRHPPTPSKPETPPSHQPQQHPETVVPSTQREL